MRFLGLLFVSSLLCACGTGGGGIHQSDGGTPTHDGSASSLADMSSGGVQDMANPGMNNDLATPPGCQALVEYGALGTVSGRVELDDQNDPTEFMQFQGAINQDTLPDVVDIQLIAKNPGPFASGVTTGTFPLDGDEAQFDSCSTCVLIWTDTVGIDIDVGQYYLATGGTLTISSAAGTLTGTLSDVSLVHVDIDSYTIHSTPNADNCTSHISSLSFSQAIP